VECGGWGNEHLCHEEPSVMLHRGDCLNHSRPSTFHIRGFMGIEPVPKEERNLKGLDFFLLWAGAGVSLAEIWAGGLVAPLGLGLGIWAIFLGHLIGNTPFALGGLIGSRWGIPTMVAVRPSFGIRGSYFAAALNVIQLIGWTAVMLIVCGGAADAISKFYGFSNPTLWIILAGGITTAWAFVGHKAWKWLQRISVFALLLLCMVMTYVVFQQYGWEMLSGIPREKGFPFMIGMDLVIAMPISWLPLVSDYSRFATDSKSSFWGTWIGYFIISSWMYLVGLATCLATRSADPSGVVMELHLSGYLLHSDIRSEHCPDAGREKRGYHRRSSGDSDGPCFSHDSRL
jgi:NCS1 family nucleobase:cation symporter-1